MKFRMTPSKLMIALFATVVLAVPAATAVLPKADRSENENRTLARFPEIVNKVKLERAENLGDVIGAVKWDYITERQRNSYMDDIEGYLSDHIAGRESWVVAKNRIEELLGKQEINDVFTVNGQMIQVFKGYDSGTVSNSLKTMTDFAARHSDVPAYIMIAPTAQEFFSAQMPSYGGYLSEKTFIEECYSSIREGGSITPIDALSFLSGHSSEYLYYRTDHHWTSLGAYYAYCSAAASMGYSAYKMDSFNIETASNSFRGTLYSRTLDSRVTPDTIDYYFLRTGEPSVKMTVFDGSKETVYDSMYVREYLDVKDKYSSFTGSNAPIVTIETDSASDKSLLVIKDSYAHSLVPFLSKHYSKITMVDMRYINVDLAYFLNVDSYSQMLFMFNAVSFSEDQNIVKLRLS